MSRRDRPTADPGPIKYAWIFFAAVAYPALAFGLYTLVAKSVFWARAETAEGTVVGWETMEDLSRRRLGASVDPARAHVVSFRSADGEEHVFVTEWGSSAVVYDSGESVTVLYRADDPGEAKIRGFISLYVGPLLLVVLGAVFWVVSLVAKAFAS